MSASEGADAAASQSHGREAGKILLSGEGRYIAQCDARLRSCGSLDEEHKVIFGRRHNRGRWSSEPGSSWNTQQQRIRAEFLFIISGNAIGEWYRHYLRPAAQFGKSASFHGVMAQLIRTVFSQGICMSELKQKRFTEPAMLSPLERLPDAYGDKCYGGSQTAGTSLREQDLGNHCVEWDSRLANEIQQRT